MLKITKSIVNGQRALIGFMVKGKESEMGGFSSMEIERGMPIDLMIKSKFNNNQVSVVNNRLVEKNTFKINQIPMCVYAPGNGTGSEYIDIDNSVDLIGRFVQDNENVGFRVRFSDGSEDNLKYANVLMLCKWFKPGNFTIRTSSKGNMYICGKKDGVNLNDLPATIIGKAPEVTPKRTKSAAKEPKPEFNGAIESGFDILDLYEFIRGYEGAVIKLPDVEYENADGTETITEGFTSLGIGEVASPVPLYNATKLNVNAGFKKVGIVPVNINGMQTNVTTFVFRTKSLFLNGENYMHKFGVAIPSDKEEAFVKQLGRSLALTKIEDPAVINPLSQVINVKSLVFYTVESGKLDLISEKKRAASILSSKQLIALCKKMYELKLLSKALGPKGGLLKELKAEFSDADVAEATDKKLFGIFSMMNNEGLEAVSAAGIDIYTGAYKVAAKSAPKSSETKEGPVNIEIEYCLDGYEADKLTGKQILEYVKAEDTVKIPAVVVKCVGSLLKIEDKKEMYRKAKEIYDTTEKSVAELNKKFWMHNASMYLVGNKSRIHTHDAKHWIPEVNTRVKKYNVYRCNYKGAEALTVKVLGVEI